MKIKYLGELWADIKGYVGLYQVSNFGRVRRIRRVVTMQNHTEDGTQYTANRLYVGMIMKTRKTQFGYVSVQLCKNGKYQKLLVHRLVAQAFIPNPKHLPQVNHKDEDKTNNRLSNLEWCTASYNLNYNDGQKVRLETRNKNKSYHYERMVGQYSLDGTLIKTYKNSTETGYCRECIRDCCLGKQQTSHGYIWKYVN